MVFLVVLAGVVGFVFGVTGLVLVVFARARLRRLERRVAVLEAAGPQPVRMAEVMPVGARPVFPADVAFDDAAPPSEPERAAVPDSVPDLVSIPASAPPARPKRDLEALLTLRWGVWLGSAALLLAGVFLIRYAVDAGLLGPAVRCVLAAGLGAALVAAGEFTLRRAGPRDQVPAALTAGGLAVLFGAAYGAGPLYRLLPDPVAFALLALVGVGGLALSLRQGRLVAAIGLVGAFATPLLVAGDAALGRLFLYLLVVTAAALGVVRLTAWAWLGWAAVIAGAGYVLLVLPDLHSAQAWAPALFLAASAALHVGLLPGAALESVVGRRLAWVPFAVLGAVGLLLCLVTDSRAAYAGVLLLGPIAIAKAAAEPRLDRLPWLGALFCLAVLRVIVVAPFAATGEAVTIEDKVAAVLPGDWVPAEVAPLLWTAGLVALVFAAAGLWFERRAPRPERWSALTAAVPVLCLAIAYRQVGAFQPVGLWAAEAVLLAGALVVAASIAGDRARAGVHAAGVVAALALACAMLLSQAWLTLALALFLPGLAWVEARAGLPALRRVAVVVGLVVLARLLLNRFVLDYELGTMPVANLLLAAYGAPALAFAVAAWMFQRSGDDACVAVMQAGAVALGTAFVTAEIRHAAHGGVIDAPDLPFIEAALDVDALGGIALAVMRIARRVPSLVLRRSWQLLGGAGLLGGLLLIVLNPAFTGDPVGTRPLIDDLLWAYLVPAVLAAWAVQQREFSARLASWIGGFAVLAGFAWITLEIRHLFHGDVIDFDRVAVDDAELWSWSAGWLAYGAALLAAGIWRGARALRLAALAMVALTTAKVFLFDMAGLVGLWRVLSFLGLGLALIGLGAVYRRFVVRPPAE